MIITNAMTNAMIGMIGLEAALLYNHRGAAMRGLNYVSGI
jgi:hypothetical protein